MNTATVKFTFNGLTSTDGSIDANVTGVEETNVINLYTPPEITGWVSEQPLNASTFYNLSVQFNQTLDNSLTPIITSSEGVICNFTSIDGNKVNFTVTTGSNPSSAIYSFSDVKALQGGITTNKNISVGPYLTKTEVEMDEANTFTEYDKLVKGRTQLVKLTLSKAIVGTLSLQSNPDCTYSVVTMINQSTAQFQVTPTNPIGFVLAITSNILTGYDGSQSNSITKTFNLVESQSIVNLYNSADKNTPISNFDVGTAVDLSLEVSKPIDGDLSNTSVVSSNGTHNGTLTTSTILGKYYYNFNFTPDTAGSDQWIKIQQAKDWDNFVYNLTKSGLAFNNIVLPPVPTSSGTIAVSYGSKYNYAYGDGLVTDGAKWTWDFYIKVPTMLNPSYAATGGFFGGISWQVRETQVWIRGGADWAMPPNQNWNFSSPRRLTFTRFNNTISLFIDGSYVYGITDSSRVTNLQVTGLNDRDTNPSDSRIWGMTLWNSVRTSTQILNNTLEEVAHHWLLNGNLNDSVVSGSVTLSENGTVTYATI